MDNARLLQDITYYTRMIRERTKQNEMFAQNNVYKSSKNLKWKSVSSKILTNSTYSYVKEPLPNSKLFKNSTSLPQSQSTTIIKTAVPMTKVLINPHFGKTRVHINPNFVAVKVPQSVHINPKIFEKSVQENTVISNVLVNKNNNEHLPNEKETHTSLKKDILQNSKYKFVRKTGQNNTTSLKKSPTCCVRSKFKLDRRNMLGRKRISISLKNTSKSTVKNTTPKNNILRTNLVNISGTLYRKSRNKLQKTDSNISTMKLVRKMESGCKKIVTIRSFRYVKNSEVKTLVRKAPTPRKKRISIMMATKYKLIRRKTDSSPKCKLRQIRQKKIIRRSNQFRKINVPCPIYSRYGKCSSHDKGTCRRVHDPKLIAICKKYLQGACDIENCSLSHNVTLEKMPTCKFYLDGFCSKEKCPYLHVKLNEKVEICRNFLNGFCEAADKCDKRHVHMCPEFERNGNCSKVKCPYPHSKTKLGKKLTNLTSIKLPQQKPETNKTVLKTDNISSNENCRYFITDENTNTDNDTDTDTNKKVDYDIEKIETFSNNCKYYVKDLKNECFSVKISDTNSSDSLPDFIPFS